MRVTPSIELANPKEVKLRDILEKVNVRKLTDEGNPPISGLSLDSRNVLPGYLFFALAGEKFDGHRFIPDAIQKGARVICVEKDFPLAGMIKEKGEKVTFFSVPDSRLAMAQVANNYFQNPSQNLNVIGVTGTNGKTTISYLLEEILAKQSKKVGVTGTINYRFGEKMIPSSLTTPESIDYQQILYAMKREGMQTVISEISSHALLMKRCYGTQFNIAIFSNLSRDHLEFHQDMEKYFSAKAILFREYLCDSKKPHRTAIVNIDDSYGERLKSELQIPVLTVSLQNADADFFASQIELSFEGFQTIIHSPWGKNKLSSPLLGKHNIQNTLCALAAAYAMGEQEKEVFQALIEIKGVPGRLQRVLSSHSAKTVLIDYAHTPDALQKVLETLRPLLSKGGKLLCLFGCGGDRDTGKRPLMGKIASRGSDGLILTSDNPRTEDPQTIIQEIQAGIPSDAPSVELEVDRKKAIQRAIQRMNDQDILIIAGKGHENYQILGTKKVPFDDYQEARLALQ